MQHPDNAFLWRNLAHWYELIHRLRQFEDVDRLVAAINSIADDFACILVITHIPQLKEAFNVYLEVTKTDTGSQVSLVI